ncbi:MAG: hypothetical protein U5K69_25960 [Balneolaceae bacterium]|nr:hypothetical protein [Balneolaceae bacterium]
MKVQKGLQGRKVHRESRGHRVLRVLINANVMADTLTLINSDWEEGRIIFQTGSNSTVSRNARVATLIVPEITEDVKDFGIVLVYFKTREEFTSEPNVWTELPYSILAFGNSFSYNVTYSYKAGR